MSRDAPPPRVRPPDGPLIAGWVVVGAAGAVLATLLVTAFGSAAGGWLLPLSSLAVYLVQWAILRAYLPGLRWASWVGPSALALVVSSVLLAPLFTLLGDPGGDDSYLRASLGGVLSGASVGFAQSLVLGRYVRRSEGWIPVAALGHAAQTVAAQALAALWADAPAGPEALLASFFEAAPIGAVLGLITGVALGGLLRDPLPEPALAALLQRRAARPRGRRWRVSLAIGLLLGLVLLWAGADFAYVSAGAETDDAAPADVIIVLGCPSIDNNQLSACVQVRAHHAADLYRQGLAAHVIPTGGLTGPGPSEAAALAGVMDGDGVPAAAILIEDQARNTVENIRYSRAIMDAHDWRTAILVTDPHHIRRATLIAQDAGLPVFPSPSTASPSWHVPGERLHNLARDAFALMLYQAGAITHQALPFLSIQ